MLTDYQVLGTDAFVARMDNSFKTTNFGEDSDQNEWATITTTGQAPRGRSVRVRIVTADQLLQRTVLSTVVQVAQLAPSFEHLASCWVFGAPPYTEQSPETGAERSTESVAVRVEIPVEIS